MYLLIRRNKIKSFLWNTNNTDRNDVNKQNTPPPRGGGGGGGGGGFNYEEIHQ